MVDEKDVQNPDKKVFVLCFDGTGNKFEGKDTDSNILKIYRLLDRNDRNQFSFYNPGIGTYVNNAALEHTSDLGRLKSWYVKAKDSAIGTALGEHVMSGYKFLMRYYTPEDDIYIFGFSRGAYTARFLAEMLDHIGLLSAGNEELQRFAWKCFSQWQSRKGGDSPEDKKKALELYEYMKGFRETFSRPVRRIRFLGLFDTVNSVPRFENAWMQRTKHPYTARSSAKVIRHAVSINERRAKFRQDLVAGSNQADYDALRGPVSRAGTFAVDGQQDFNEDIKRNTPTVPAPSAAQFDPSFTNNSRSQAADSTHDLQHFSDAPEQPSQPASPTQSSRPRNRSSFTAPVISKSIEDLRNHARPVPPRRRLRRRFSESERKQDILEVWFPGNHADIGGGWHKHPDEQWPLSHAPLVWMVHEAEKAGLKFDPESLVELKCCPDKIDDYGNRDTEHEKSFHDALHWSSTQGYLHDCLQVGGGPPRLSVLSWRLMEYLPFRRMDLTADGRWKPIRWPLPGGETRDIPADAKIHASAIKRMEHDETYRPGNLILMGKGGRGHKIAPKEAGIGEWDVADFKGDPVREYYKKREVMQAANGEEKRRWFRTNGNGL